jgi:hypothetical protein
MVKARRTAGMADKIGPTKGMNSSKPAISPSARALGTPISHRPSQVRTPISSIATS